MNESASLLLTLSRDELARVARYIDSPTVLALLEAEECLFAPVMHLLITKLSDIRRKRECWIRTNSYIDAIDCYTRSAAELRQSRSC